MVQAAAQYVFIHKVLVEAIENEPNGPNPGVSPEFATFLKGFTANSNYDIGSNGREILHLGEFLRKTDQGMETFVLALCNDVLLITQKVGKKEYLLRDKPCDRARVIVKRVGTQWDEALLKVTTKTQTFLLEAPSDEFRDQWVEYLSNLEDHDPNPTGPRLVPSGPRSRSEIIALLDIPDPFSEEGAKELAKEWNTIPRVC